MEICDKAVMDFLAAKVPAGMTHGGRSGQFYRAHYVTLLYLTLLFFSFCQRGQRVVGGSSAI